MTAPPPAHPAAVPPPPEEPKPTGGSTSSSGASSPTGGVPLILQTLHVRLYESQRWFPVVGWNTSRLPADPPNFSAWAPIGRDASAAPSAAEVLNADVLQTNDIRAAPPGTQRPQQPIVPLNVRLPDGYVWEGYWEVCLNPPHGADASGWRYAENFTVTKADGSSHAAHFKKTQTPTCVVRRRMWQRRVRLAKGGPTDSSEIPLGTDEPSNESEESLKFYITEKQDEMRVAEGLKTRRQQAVDAGAEWTQQNDLEAEEELRAFIRERRQQFTESATRRLVVNNSFANPFHLPGGAEVSAEATTAEHAEAPQPAFSSKQYQGAVAASTWAVDSKIAHEHAVAAEDGVAVSDDDEFVKDIQQRQLASGDAGAYVEQSGSPLLVDGQQDADAPALTFYHGEPTPREAQFGASTSRTANEADDDDGPLEQQNTISQFVAASPTDEGPEVESTPTDAEGTNDFNAIFSKFMSNPEVGNAKPSNP